MMSIRTVLIVVCCLCVASFLFSGVVGAAFRYDLDNYEGVLFDPAIRLASGGPIYGQQLVLSEPYLCAGYGPLYYAILGSVLRVTGLTFWPGRLLSLLATLATGLLLYNLVRNEQKTATAGFVAATLFIMSPATWSVGFFQRVDALGVFFSTVCLALVWRSNENLRKFVLAGCAAALAFLIKPNFVAASLAVIACLTIARAFRQLGAFLAGGAIVATLAVVGLQLTGNQGYVWNQFMYVHTLFPLGVAVSNFRELIQSQTVIASVAVSSLLLVRADLRSRKVSDLLPLVYLMVATVLGLVAASKIGSGINHFYEFSVALALCAGLVFGRIKKVRETAYLITVLFLIVSLSVELAFRSNYFIKDRLFFSVSKASLHEKIIQDLIEYVPDEEPIASHYPDLVLRAGRRLIFGDVLIYTLGPDDYRSRLSSYLAERKLGAYIAMRYLTIPGYTLVEGPELSHPPPGNLIPGPLLYLRDDLWQKRAQAIRDAP